MHDSKEPVSSSAASSLGGGALWDFGTASALGASSGGRVAEALGAAVGRGLEGLRR